MSDTKVLADMMIRTGFVTGHGDTVADLVAELEPQIERLRAEVERERLRLAACGVVATADTTESAAKARQMHDDYKSASCDDVARRVDECMRLRAEVAGLKSARIAYASEFPLNVDGEPDVGSIHQNIRSLKAERDRLRELLLMARPYVEQDDSGLTRKGAEDFALLARINDALKEQKK